jgi:hypothetical protein
MKATTKKHIRENTRPYKKYSYMHSRYSYWYQHTNSVAFELRWLGTVIKYYDNSCIPIGRATSKKQFVDVVYDYLNLKNTQS